MITPLIAAAIISATPSASGTDNGCVAELTDSGAILPCTRPLPGDAAADQLPDGVNPAVRLTYTWLPACTEATPGNPGAASVSCVAMNSCPDPMTARLTLWGAPVGTSHWFSVVTECRPVSDIGQAARQLTPGDVLTAIRRVGLPAGEVEAPAYTLVNLDTTFYTEPQTLSRTLDIIGFTVEIEATPTSYVWHWGDGTTTTTDTPGRPYPATDITHTYTRATRGDSELALSVDVTYAARYRVDGTDWIDLDDTITIPGPPTTIPIRQASGVLVQPD